MIDLIFPDGSKRPFDDGVTGKDVAASIAISLAKRAVLVKLDGELLDLDRPLPHGGKVRDPDARLTGGSGDHPPRRLPRDGRGGAGALPRHAGDDRALDRGRLLLRLRPAPSRSAWTTWRPSSSG